MKTLVNPSQFFIFLLSIAVITGCSSTRNTSNSQQFQSPQVIDRGYNQVDSESTNQSNPTVSPNEKRPSNISLNDMLIRLPGVRVQGNGAYARITVSGSASFMSGTDPLFVVNGVVRGTDYSIIHSAINPNDVTSLSVLKGPDATIYGTQGANGVILIRTK
ncbi:MAG: TonB-dependent receptor plug domain-containing protein [Deltaproteobacteria bacterium]|jgi:TonB-dependent SusC/RagA subfamily outer membrane receptor|nr:TonB-dependent receptor plug domain-containing protein [Deltaproteobacteria bacterium]